MVSLFPCLLLLLIGLVCGQIDDNVFQGGGPQMAYLLRRAIQRKGLKIESESLNQLANLHQASEKDDNVSLEQLKKYYSSKMENAVDTSFIQKKKSTTSERLSGHAQKSNKHTPAGTVHEGFKMTPLDDYVSKPDSHYKWEEMEHYYDEIAFDIHFLNVTSQKWLDESKVSRSIWWHIVGVIRPLIYNETRHALMYITGSGNPSTPGQIPELKDEGLLLASFLAIETGSIVSVVYQIPNERIEFYDEKPTPRSRGEDAIIAYTWDHFLKHPQDSEWLLRLPMVKGSVRALDAVEEYVQKKWNNKIEEWVVTGASKRGWTTWVLGGYDAVHEKRIVAIVPMVMSFINFHPQIHSWWKAMGGWSFALKDYYELNITTRFDIPQTQMMADIVDPLSYFERMENLPKLQVMASGDEFFQLQDPRQYWSKLPGEKHLLICENAEHSLISSLLDLLPSIAAYYRSFIHKNPRPQISWTMDYKNQKIRIQSNVKPSRVKVWSARTFSTSRVDFRVVTAEDPCPFPPIKDLCPQPIVWFPTSPTTKVSDLIYESEMVKPTSGWAGFFMQMQFDDQGAGTSFLPHVFTSEAMVVPDELPFPDCSNEGCRGTLI